MAEALANRNSNWNVHFVLSGELLSLIRESNELALILANPAISFLAYDIGDEVTTKKENRRLMQLYLKRKFIPIFLQRWLIRVYSNRFYSFMVKRLGPDDIYHHFFGFTGLATGLRLREKVSLSISELTSPVYGPVVTHYWRLFNGISNRRLRLLAGTELIFKQVQDFSVQKPHFQKWMESYLYKYPLPFLKPAPKLEPAKKENLIIFASNFFQRKNPDLFAQAVAELINEGELGSWKVKVRGKGPLDAKVRTLLARAIEAKRVEVGFSNNLEDELVKAKVFVSIISTGNYPSQSVFEAYARGNLLLLSDRGNSREKFTHPSIQFVDLSLEAVKNGLLACVKLAEAEAFEAVSSSIHAHYIETYDHQRVLQWLDTIYSGKKGPDLSLWPPSSKPSGE